MFDRIKALNRRTFVRQGAKSAASVVAGALAAPEALASAFAAEPADGLRLAIATAGWAQGWALPTLLRNVQRAGVAGVELRPGGEHGVAPEMSDGAREEARLRFDNSPVALLGLAMAEPLHLDDRPRLERDAAAVREHLRLSGALGGSAVRVATTGVTADETFLGVLEELGGFAAEHGQELRLELPTGDAVGAPAARVLEATACPGVRLCWSGEPADAASVTQWLPRLGGAVRVHELDAHPDAYAELFRRLIAGGYHGWIVLEARSEPADRVRALAEQRAVFDRLVADARARAQGS